MMFKPRDRVQLYDGRGAVVSRAYHDDWGCRRYSVRTPDNQTIRDVPQHSLAPDACGSTCGDTTGRGTLCPSCRRLAAVLLFR
jgi:hypothetical protein